MPAAAGRLRGGQRGAVEVPGSPSPPGAAVPGVPGALQHPAGALQGHRPRGAAWDGVGVGVGVPGGRCTAPLWGVGVRGWGLARCVWGLGEVWLLQGGGKLGCGWVMCTGEHIKGLNPPVWGEGCGWST